MNRLLLIIFCIFFNSPCFSEWKFVYKQTNGYDVYVDFQSIKFRENFVFWSELVNFSESLSGMMSMTVKMKGDCKEAKQTQIQHKSRHQEIVEVRICSRVARLSLLCGTP